jgi:DNA topoisomerase II
MSILNKYRYQSDIQHVLANPGMYLGSTEPLTQTIWVYDEKEERIRREETEFHAALYKMVDEALSNSYDHYVRCSNSALEKVSYIKVAIDDTSLSIMNDGEAIDVVMHEEMKVYVPEMIFGHLRTSTNYGAEDKIVGGKHGLGIKLASVFSTEFELEVCDSPRGLLYTQKFSNNLERIHEPVIKKKAARSSFVGIRFTPDFARFGLDKFPDYMSSLVKKRLYDLAIFAPDVKFSFNGRNLVKRTFKNYITACVGTSKFAIFESKHWKIAAAASNDGAIQVSFVNGISTLNGGCHVEHAALRVLAKVRDLAKEKKKLDIPSKVFRDQMFLFVSCDAINPSFAGQMKESLINKQFCEPLEIPAEFSEKVFKLVGDAACAILTTKQKIQKERQETRLLAESNGSKSRTVNGIPELTDANWAGTSKSMNCVLIVCEGESAATGVLSGLKTEDRNRYGVYPVRGKIVNPQDKGAEKIASNKIIVDLKKILGLESGKEYSDARKLRYGKIVFMTDQDLDGHHIKALGLNVFHTLWPSLLNQPEFLGFIQTPILKARRGAQEISFFYEQEYLDWKDRTPSSHSWTVKYYKGLGTSTTAEFRQYFASPRIICFRHAAQDKTTDAFQKAFSKSSADARKKWLSEYNKSRAMKIVDNRVSYDDFIDNELVHFSKYDCDRSIPSVDGLKVSQRKILFAAFQNFGSNSSKELKVAQFCGRVAELTHYHHGEGNLESTIVGMAQDFVGSNNINLLMPLGQFGSRRQGGQDAAAARYIFTNLNEITCLIYRREDEPILEYLEEDGARIEPRFYVPIIPMILVNGALGIGTGFSCTVLPYKVRAIISHIRSFLEDEMKLELKPFFKGFKGTVQKGSDARHYSSIGVFSQEGTRLIIKELPIGMWTLSFKEHLEALVETGVVVAYIDLSTDVDILFDIRLDKELSSEQIIKTFKLKKNHYESNMYLFDLDDKLRKFNEPSEIIDYYIPIRLNYYQKRKDYLLAELARRILVARNKARYIESIIKGSINVFVKKNILAARLKEEKFDYVDNSFNYLFKMPIDSLCEENAETLKKNLGTLLKEERILEETTIESMWLKELEELEARVLDR